MNCIARISCVFHNGTRGGGKALIVRGWGFVQSMRVFVAYVQQMRVAMSEGLCESA